MGSLLVFSILPPSMKIVDFLSFIFIFYQNICRFLDKFIKSILKIFFLNFRFFSINAKKWMRKTTQRRWHCLLLLRKLPQFGNWEISKLFCIAETFPDWFKSIKIWGLISCMQTIFEIVNCYRYMKIICVWLLLRF